SAAIAIIECLRRQRPDKTEGTPNYGSGQGKSGSCHRAKNTSTYEQQTDAIETACRERSPDCSCYHPEQELVPGFHAIHSCADRPHSCPDDDRYQEDQQKDNLTGRISVVDRIVVGIGIEIRADDEASDFFRIFRQKTIASHEAPKRRP